MPLGDPRLQTAIRLTVWEKQTIEARAKQHDLTFSEYMRRCALGLLHDPGTLEGRFDQLEAEVRERLDKLERIAELSY